MFASLRREHLPLHLFILVFWLLTLQIGRLSGYVNSILELFKSHIYFVNYAPCKFFYAFSELFFHIAKPVFNLVCLHFIPQSNVSFCNFGLGGWRGGRERGGLRGVDLSGAISYCALTFYPFRLLSIYLFILLFLFDRTFIDNRIYFLTNLSCINMINNNSNKVL